MCRTLAVTSSVSRSRSSDRIAGSSASIVAEQPRIEDRAVLDDFGEAGAEFPGRERPQRLDVGDHEPRLMEGADQVLPQRVVDGGLAADRRIDLRQERRRHLDDGHATQQRRSREAREIADHAAPQRHDDGAPIEAGLEEAIVDDGKPREILVLFAVRQRHDDRLEVRIAQRPHERFAPQRLDALAGHDRAPTAEPRARQARTDEVEQVAADEHRICALAELDAHLLRLSLDHHPRLRRPTTHRHLTEPPRASRHGRRPRPR